MGFSVKRGKIQNWQKSWVVQPLTGVMLPMVVLEVGTYDRRLRRDCRCSIRSSLTPWTKMYSRKNTCLYKLRPRACCSGTLQSPAQKGDW